MIDVKSKVRRCFSDRHIGNLARIIIQICAGIVAGLVLHPSDKSRTCLGQRIDLVERRHERFHHRIIKVRNRSGDVNFSKMMAVGLPKYRLRRFG